MEHNSEESWSRRRLLQSATLAAALAAVRPSMLPADAQGPPAATPQGQSEGKPRLLGTLRPGHPRLIASSGSWAEIQKRRGEDALLDAFLRRGEAEARAILEVPPIAYKKDGKRLLHVSRVVLRRVLLLCLHFRLSGDAAFLQRARSEMLSAASFGDWNPSHFLDTAELCAALALGYDWLFDQLDEGSRQAIRTAIVEKGLKPGLADKGFQNIGNNWNSVCLCGIALGALAVAEDEPGLAEQVLAKAKDYNANGLKPYAPDGVYPEGAMYWGYGTTFEVMLLDALGTALGTDWGLSQSPGFLHSAQALLQQLGPTGAFFNFSDNTERGSVEPAMWWFARALGQPGLLRWDSRHLRETSASSKPPQPLSEDDRVLPLAALWWPEPAAKTGQAPTAAATIAALPLSWRGRGAQALASFRDSRDDAGAMFLALKGGGASLSHAHMDAGSFVFEALGVRWARDLGMQSYLSLESKGLDLWHSGQDAGRWKVFRLGPFGHSTLTINSQLHRANGLAAITHFSDTADLGAILDLSPVFAGQASRARRGFAFRPGSHALIRDELEGLNPGDVVRWAMLTRSKIELSPDGSRATLSEGGQQLSVSLKSSVGGRLEAISAEPPANNYDEPNPGFSLLIANLKAPASGRVDASVVLQPIVAGRVTEVEDKLSRIELSLWPMAPAK